MTTYPGPWIQAPDYVRDGQEGIVSASPYGDTIPTETHVVAEQQVSAEFEPFTPADIEPIAQATGSAGKTTPSSPPKGEGFINHEISYGAFGLSEYARNQQAWRNWRVSSISPESLGVRYWAPVSSLIDVPPGAIGWEWADGSTAGDSAKSEVVRLEGEFQFAATTPDAQSSLYGPVLLQPWWTAIATSSGHFVSDDGPVLTSSTDWLTAWDGNGDFYDARDNPTEEIVKVIDGPLVAAAGHESEPVVVENIDLTSRLDDKGRLVLASTVSFRAPTSDLERTGIVDPWSATGEDPFLMDDDIVRYGHNYVVIPHWTFRPPVFRWLYATPQITSAPPLRHTQRDDRHGPSPRNNPTRSRQAGHRNTGYL